MDGEMRKTLGPVTPDETNGDYTPTSPKAEYFHWINVREKTMVKIWTGQVWEFDFPIGGITRRTVRNVIRNAPYHDDVFFECGNYMSTRDMTSAEFIPQNDLEWLAVNADEWYSTSNVIYKSRLNEVRFAFRCSGMTGYTREQWQNMRYHLGLDKKPHYRLTGGEWVKQ